MPKVKIYYAEPQSTEILGGPEEFPELLLDLDKNGHASLMAWSHHKTHNGMSENAYHNILLVWQVRLPADSLVIEDVVALKKIAIALRPLLQRVHDGHEVGWSEDSNNVIGTLTKRAQKASDKIEEMLQTTVWYTDAEVWYADVWLYGSGESNLEIVKSCGGDVAQILDENNWDSLTKVVKDNISDEAKSNCIYLHGDLEKLVRDMIVSAREELLETIED